MNEALSGFPYKLCGFQCVDLIHNNIRDLENLHTQEQITLAFHWS